MALTLYLDHNATTSLDPRVLSVMQEALAVFWANPSSVHSPGREAKIALQSSQKRIAAYFGVMPQQLLFTSGATEALNVTLRGLCTPSRGGHIVTATTEHAAVAATIDALEQQGMAVTRLATGPYGAVNPGDVAAALRSDTVLMSFMAANNETGVKSDLEALAQLSQARNIPLVIDGVALLGKEILPRLSGPVVWCFSGHKIHGPLGIGLVVLPPRLRLQPLISGGPQQYGRRGGTENLVAILGLSEAIACLADYVPAAYAKMLQLRDYFEATLQRELGSLTINGTGPRIANTSNIAFHGLDGEALLYLLDQHGLAASMGSACTSGALEPSRILLAMGYPREHVLASLRFSLSRMTTQSEIDTALAILIPQVKHLRRGQDAKSGL